MTETAQGNQQIKEITLGSSLVVLEQKIVEQQTLLNEAAILLEQSDLADSISLATRIKTLTTEPVSSVKPVEWFDVVDLPAYEPGAQYLMLVADEHHQCTEQNQLLQRWFRDNQTGELFTLDDIEAWRPIKDHQPPAGWVECSPAWLNAGGKCGDAPRWHDGKIGNHYHPDV